MINPISRNVSRALAAFDVPGASVAVVKDDALVFAAGFGTKTLGGAAPVDEHSLFAAGSISKSVTATCLAILVGEGKLGWDDRVTDYLPGFQARCLNTGLGKRYAPAKLGRSASPSKIIFNAPAYFDPPVAVPAPPGDGPAELGLAVRAGSPA